MSKYIVGIDIGGTNIKAGVLDKEGNIIYSCSIKTLADNGSEDVLNRISNLVSDMLNENKISKEDVAGIGMGIPGPVNTDTGVVSFCPNMKGWENLNASKKLEELTSLAVKVGNDVNVITMGEAWIGAAKGYLNVLGLTLGTGIGGGIVVNGKLVSGVSGGAGEIGHIKVEFDGKLCGCGQRGCWEAYASATGLQREAISRLSVNKENLLYKRLNGDIYSVEAKDIFDCAKEGDKFSLDLVEFEIKYLSFGLSGLINTLNPEVVVVGGGISLAGNILFDKLNEALKDKVLSVGLKELKILPAKLGNNAGVVGAAAMFQM